MTQKLILSLFTFWLGVSGTLAAPLSLFGAGFQLTSVVRAEAPPPAAEDAAAATCRYLLDVVQSTGVEAKKDVNRLANVRGEVVTSIQDTIWTAWDASDFFYEYGYIEKIVVSELGNGQQQIVQEANGSSRPSMKAYQSAVFNLGKQKECAAQYKTAADAYNALVLSFNRQVVPFPPSDTAQKLIAKFQAEKNDGTKWIVNDDVVAKEITDGVNGFIARTAEQKQIKLDTLVVLPAEAKDLPATNPGPNKGEGDSSRPGPSDPELSQAAGIHGDDCGLDDLKPFGKGPIADVFNNTVKPLFGLACIMLQGMYELFINSLGWADCAMNGRELPQICKDAEEQNRKANEAAEPPLDTSEDEIPTVDDEGVPSSIPPPTTNSPGTSPPIFQDTSPFPS